MLLLVTIGLVLVGAVSLVVGFVSDSLPWIYVSIGCSVLAALVLLVFARMGKRQAATGSAAPSSSRPASWSPPAPSGSWSPSETPASFSAPQPSPVTDAPTRQTPAWEPEPEDEPDSTPEPAVAEAAPASPAGDFPIPRYDELRVSQIQPLLAKLDLDDLDVVREREELGKNRPTLLRMLDARIELLETRAEASVAPDADGDGSDDDLADDDLADDDLADDVEDLGAPPAAAPSPDREPIVGQAAPSSGDFPIPDYDERTVAEIIARLDDLDNDELDMVAEHEELGRNRAAILDAIDAMFDDDDEVPPPPPPPPVVARRAPARKAPAAKAAKMPGAKRAPAKATPAPRRAANVPAARAAKAPAIKAVQAGGAAAVKKAATVKKATAKAATKATTKAAATKATAKKRAPAKKAPPRT